jgi:hypothetical protein
MRVLAKTVRLMALIGVLASCVARPESGPDQVMRLTAEISAFQSDPRIKDFLAREAASAGVRAIRSMPVGTAIGAYGLTTSGGIIYLNTAKPGGTSIINITHEIAHVEAFGGACGGHNSRWLAAYMAIAGRFEAEFPGYLWNGRKPTDWVKANIALYGIGTRCP